MKNIIIIITGGTIDKIHNPIKETLDFSDHSLMPQMLEECGVRHARYVCLMLKDSMDMTDEDRQKILDTILEQDAEAVVITHGTSTMETTAEFLKNRVGNKTVVLTGAKRPYSFSRSDAKFNLGAAFAAAQMGLPGVYIAIQGGIYEAGQVRKNVETCTFEEC